MTTAATSLPNRNIRQRELVPDEKLQAIDVTVIGVGAIGRQVALQLAAIGAPRIQLIDFDTVEEENLAAQGFLESDLGRNKVDAVAEMCQRINSEIEVKFTNRKFGNTMFTGGAVFCCVDSIDTRKAIFGQINNRADLWIDGRMSAEFMRILTVWDDKSAKFYETQLFPGNEAYQGSCTAKSTIYCASGAATIMVSQFAKWLRGCQLDYNINFNLLTNELLAQG